MIFNDNILYPSKILPIWIMTLWTPVFDIQAIFSHDRLFIDMSQNIVLVQYNLKFAMLDYS